MGLRYAPPLSLSVFSVTVGWEYEQYSVLESVRTVELCAILDAVLLSQDVVVHVHTEEVNAEGMQGSSFFLGTVTALGVLCCFALLYVPPCLLLSSFLLISH